MGVYRFADLIFKIENKDNFTEKLCKDYAIDSKSDIVISVTKEDIDYESTKSEDNFPFGYLESLAIYRMIAESVLEFNTFLFHSSALEVDGEAYLFTAPSGTGKSTHAKLWKEFFKDRAVIINDDKPLLGFRRDGIYVYGTPWCGKHGLQTNKKVKIKAVCILEQGIENSIRQMTFSESYPMILNQTYRPNDKEKMIKTLELVNGFIECIPIYKLCCNISEEAVKVAYQGMNKN